MCVCVGVCVCVHVYVCVCVVTGEGDGVRGVMLQSFRAVAGDEGTDEAADISSGD